MRKTILRLAITAGMAICLSGCVGAGIVTGQVISWDASDGLPTGLCPSKSERSIVGCSFRRFNEFSYLIDEVTPEKLLNWWGTPKSDSVVNDKRVIVYDRSLAWRGAVMFLIIPVPLLIPLGHDEATFSFSNEHLVHVEYVENRLSAAVCGLHGEGPDGFGCTADWH